MTSLRHLVKILIVISVLLLVSCSSGSNVLLSQQDIYGSGVLDQETRTFAGGCTGVTFAAAGDLDIELGAQEVLWISAEDNLLPYLESNVMGTTLMIQEASGVDLRPSLPVEFDLTISQLDELTHVGVGTIDIDSPASTQLSLTLSGVGEINANNYSGQVLDVTQTGVGDVRVSGGVISQTVVVSGVGDYEGAALMSMSAVVTLTSAGSVTVRVSGTLDVTITGSGTVYYIGNPVITSNITGTGSLQKIG
ncbi:MAG: hypothetical protein GTN89_04525 [Acidobacteria bacterium]|nr:hypothetical protein [Acidobacteriota bacterium]NIM60410.1 hypothetical protein [Acidobacteriota bacterium]NIO58585.1 hypothetical protein [Acidobacteriota bacterium]NIQ29637.1 hypothetical protein [Acidobacteriota bacterium]NIQ84354.1 hypothetical protein [Acidobacteriota bacterium]